VSEAQGSRQGGQATPSMHPYRPFAACLRRAAPPLRFFLLPRSYLILSPILSIIFHPPPPPLGLSEDCLRKHLGLRKNRAA
jgi:hypothetical protein